MQSPRTTNHHIKSSTKTVCMHVYTYERVLHVRACVFVYVKRGRKINNNAIKQKQNLNLYAFANTHTRCVLYTIRVFQMKKKTHIITCTRVIHNIYIYVSFSLRYKCLCLYATESDAYTFICEECITASDGNHSLACARVLCKKTTELLYYIVRTWNIESYCDGQPNASFKSYWNAREIALCHSISLDWNAATCNCLMWK